MKIIFYNVSPKEMKLKKIKLEMDDFSNYEDNISNIEENNVEADDEENDNVNLIDNEKGENAEILSDKNTYHPFW
ncbi:hypothetical protein TNCT_39111 [Trichonephila clavata]|uniref:Uncharacterized protein n=1 Tax=Trichonephila clavata TaxID=2740835 RepID=A0A8X6HUG3_TRICU|nr:hypothetical protein TNCT_39111 [Trichonephila clavata]